MPDQRSEQWFADRLGHVTASRVSHAIAGLTTATRRNYLLQLVSERLTNTPQPSYSNASMEWGTEQEPHARAAYMASYELVEEVGFIKHPAIEWFGASPDGLVGTDGLVEIKCPNTTTHIDWLEVGRVPAEHKPQMIAQLLCTSRKWVDFVSYDPRLPNDLQLFVVRFEPDEKEKKAVEEKVISFLTDVQQTIDKLRGNNGQV